LIFFLLRLRPQVRFEDAAQLVRQIEGDVERSKAEFNRSFEASLGDYRDHMAGYAAALTE